MPHVQVMWATGDRRSGEAIASNVAEQVRLLGFDPLLDK